MKIYVCIPSINEEKTIGKVTNLVDLGLQSLYLQNEISFEAKILNIDSSSEDKTVNVFNKTNTKFPKQSIILKGRKGKGKNLLSFIKIAYDEGATYFLTIDADINSADPSWINKLLEPLLNNEADFVTPLYARSRFEGSSTNHFAYPIVLALTGINARQPIAGDFAFNAKLAKLINNSIVPESANNYGVDIYLTLTALTNALRHKQVILGEKMHNPSFNKLEYMFPQIATSALSVLRQYNLRDVGLINIDTTVNNIASVTFFPHKKDSILMRDRAIMELSSKANSWVPEKIFQKIKSGQIDSEEWVTILARWIKYGIENKTIAPEILSNQLLPFFVLRATTFWFLSEKMTAEQVEEEINKQALALHTQLNVTPSKN